MAESPQIRMVNDIAVQFHHQSQDEAVKAVATHLRMFWDPRMRAEIRELAGTTPDAFDPIALAAARQLT